MVSDDRDAESAGQSGHRGGELSRVADAGGSGRTRPNNNPGDDFACVRLP